MRKLLLTATVAMLTVACATSPTGRRQLQLMSESRMSEMGTEAYKEMKEKTPVSEDSALNEYALCIANSITSVVGGEYRNTRWEVTVFESDQVNAFALPGGKIGIYTGLMKVADNQHQLAAVVGHEIGHVMANHSNERLSTQYATSAGLAIVQAIAGAETQQKQQALALLGLGAQVGVILPFSRTHESEADDIGQELMSRAGFDPRESVTLWQNMAKASDGAPPELLSTHPSHSTRINDLQKGMKRAVNLYEKAKLEGRRPNCQRPASLDKKGDGNRP